jgi:hypothetical protein
MYLFFQNAKEIVPHKNYLYVLCGFLVLTSVFNIFNAFSSRCCPDDDANKTAQDFTRVNLFISGFVIAAALLAINEARKGQHQKMHNYIALALFILTCVFSFISNGTGECKHHHVFIPSVVFAVALLGVPSVAAYYAYYKKKKIG